MICSLKLKVRAAFPEKLVRKNTNMAILGCFGDFALVTQILIFVTEWKVPVVLSVKM